MFENQTSAILATITATKFLMVESLVYHRVLYSSLFKSASVQNINQTKDLHVPQLLKCIS